MGARGGNRSFGAGSHARRHQQGYQALTGALVMGLAIATLTLHHFGFGFALVLAIAAAAICALARVRPTVAVYLTGAALLAGILIAPPYMNEPHEGSLVAPVSYPIGMDQLRQVYVLDGADFPRMTQPAPRIDRIPESWRPSTHEPAPPPLLEL